MRQRIAEHLVRVFCEAGMPANSPTKPVGYRTLMSLARSKENRTVASLDLDQYGGSATSIKCRGTIGNVSTGSSAPNPMIAIVNDDEGVREAMPGGPQLSSLEEGER